MTSIVTCLPQERETPAQLIRRGNFTYRYAYSRSADNQQAGDSGQDYLALREDEERLGFALCDGVSQSFFGNLAAQWVGDALLDWLWGELAAGADKGDIENSLTLRLNDLAVSTAEQVHSHRLPDDLPPLVRDVLEEKRAAGSQSTFVGGLVDIGRQRLVLVWMGDSRVRMWDVGGSEVSDYLGDTFHTHERWSSRQGIVGQIHVFVCPLGHVSRLVVHSDGMDEIRDVVAALPDNHDLNMRIAELTRTPTSDDVSFLEIWVGPERNGNLFAALESRETVAALPAAHAGSETRTGWTLALVSVGVLGSLACILVVVGSLQIPAVRALLVVPSASPTLTLTPLPPPATLTPIPPPTPLPSAAPTLSPTPSPSSTITPTPTASPTLPPTTTPMLTWTSSPTPPPTTTPLPTWTASPTPGPPAMPVVTWTPTPAPTATLPPTLTPLAAPQPANLPVDEDPRETPAFPLEPVVTPTVELSGLEQRFPAGQRRVVGAGDDEWSG